MSGPMKLRALQMPMRSVRSLKNASRAGKPIEGLHVDAHRGDGATRAHRLDRLGERGLVAHALQHRVWTAPARLGAELLGGIAAVEAHRDAAQLLRELQAIVHAVDHEDPARSEEMGRLQREQADRARAEHGHRVTGSDRRVLRAARTPVERMSPRKNTSLVGHPGGHRLAHVVRERHPDGAPPARPGTACRSGRRTPRGRWWRTAVGSSHAAPLAEAARDRERGEHAVALLAPGAPRSRTSSTTPMNSWPITMPGSRPGHRARGTGADPSRTPRWS